MGNLGTWLVMILINACLAQSENVEVSKLIEATVDKNVDRAPQVKITSTTERLVVISEKSQKMDQQPVNPESGDSSRKGWPSEYERVLQEMDIEKSVRTGFYLLMTISVGALIFVGWKIYKLRMSRAERKYGVQGDRTTQELAPLPISMEDADSDEEDQTIFDAHRSQIRIF